MAELHRESPLFDRLLPIQITDDVHDNRGTNLVLRILKGSQPTASAGQIESVLHIEVTDDNDPCFLFYMDVGESSFHILKRDQAILVEFKVFPVKLIELIELCLLNPTNSAALKSSKSQATGSSSFANALEEEISTAAERNMHNCLGDESFFNAKLNTVTGVFSVVESNKFKQLTHISLVLQAGDDTAIKRYLASRLTLTLDVAAKQTADISRLSVAQEQAHRAMEDMKEELNAMRYVPCRLTSI